MSATHDATRAPPCPGSVNTSWRSARISSEAATISESIFALPQPEAGITMPCPAAIERSPETANSRPTMTTTIQAGASPSSTSEMKTAEMSSLSAIGSSSVPEGRDLPPPPREPAVQKVGRRGRQEDQEADRLAPVELRQQDDDEKRNEEDSKEGQGVWEVQLHRVEGHRRQTGRPAPAVAVDADGRDRP